MNYDFAAGAIVATLMFIIIASVGSDMARDACEDITKTECEFRWVAKESGAS